MDGWRTIDEHGLATVEVRRDAQDGTTPSATADAAHDLDDGGCASWYSTRTGATPRCARVHVHVRALTRHFDRPLRDDHA